MSEPRAARQHLEKIFHSALAAVRGSDRVAGALREQPLSSGAPVVALGKAAASMLEGALQGADAAVVSALLISKAAQLHAHVCGRPGVLCLAGGHPLPDARSLAAGRQLLAFLQACPPQQEVLFLVSGGSSSLVEVLRTGRNLADLQRVNHWLLGSGLDIVAINRVRRQLSAIKGGGLLHYLQGRPARVLLMSDVPDDDPAVIGSGLLFPPRDGSRAMPDLPAWISDLLEPETQRVPAPAKVSYRIVATLEMALAAAAQCARDLGYPARVRHPGLAGDAGQCGAGIADFLAGVEPGVYLWGGETTVRLPRHPGVGGRNQQLALSAALRLSGRRDIELLAAGSDGEDGNSQAAGAIVDGGTVARAQARGVGARACLEQADARRCLAASGDLLVTGPTGTNVTDLVIGVKLATGNCNA
jgi:hydroxypyruvate reductase